MITPYLTNDFSYYLPPGSATNTQWWAVRVVEGGVRKHLWVFGNLNLDPWTGANDDRVDLLDKLLAYGFDFGTGTVLQSFDNPNSNPSLSSFRLRNSVYWGPRQYANLPSSLRSSLDTNNFDIATVTTNDYNRGHLQHWLKIGRAHV